MSSQSIKDQVDGSFLLGLYRNMFLIRNFELKVNELFLKGFIPGTIHLSHGQEAVPVGVSAALLPQDIIIPTHRGHGHALAKGMQPVDLFAELFAKKTGCSKGKGGSLHIGDMSRGIAPGNPVVGSSIPVGAGMAFAMQYQKLDGVVVNYFGDGAVNTGPFHEGVNLAAIWQLPLILVCENNQYAISTNVKSVTLLNELVERSRGYGVPGIHVDGNDVIAVFNAATEAIDRARSGHGPTFIECLTYRQGGHKRDDPGTYRPEKEVKKWLAYDPLVLTRGILENDKHIPAHKIDEIEAAVITLLDTAVETALASPAADPLTVMSDVYA